MIASIEQAIGIINRNIIATMQEKYDALEYILSHDYVFSHEDEYDQYFRHKYTGEEIKLNREVIESLTFFFESMSKKYEKMLEEER